MSLCLKVLLPKVSLKYTCRGFTPSLKEGPLNSYSLWVLVKIPLLPMHHLNFGEYQQVYLTQGVNLPQISHFSF